MQSTVNIIPLLFRPAYPVVGLFNLINVCIVEIKFYYTQKMLILNIIDPTLDVGSIIILLQVCLSGSYIAMTYLDITISNNIILLVVCILYATEYVCYRCCEMNGMHIPIPLHVNVLWRPLARNGCTKT